MHLQLLYAVGGWLFHGAPSALYTVVRGDYSLIDWAAAVAAAASCNRLRRQQSAATAGQQLPDVTAISVRTTRRAVLCSTGRAALAGRLLLPFSTQNNARARWGLHLLSLVTRRRLQLLHLPRPCRCLLLLCRLPTTRHLGTTSDIFVVKNILFRWVFPTTRCRYHSVSPTDHLCIY